MNAFDKRPNMDRILGLSDAEWLEDIDALYDHLVKDHPNPFRWISEDALNSHRLSIRMRMRFYALSPERRLCEAIKLPALLRDGHTRFIGVDYPLVGVDVALDRLPIELRWYENGLFVDAATDEWQEILGARLRGIGGVSAQTLMDRCAALVSAENRWRVRAVAPRLLTRVAILAGLGAVATDREAVSLELSICGEDRAVDLRPMSAELPAASLVRAHGSHSTLDRWEPSLSGFWLSEAEGIYVMKFDGVRDEQARTLREMFEAGFDEADAGNASTLVVDLRWNPGGDNRLNWPLIYGIVGRPALNRKGCLFALIGRDTFSAAMNCAVFLEKHTQVTFVGEPTGTSPNHFGDAIEHELPNSRLRVGISSLWWQESWPWDERREIDPEVSVSYRQVDYARGQDAALDAVRMMRARRDTSTG